MRDHALPQDVTGYRFHLIGNMTIKQFAEMLIGCIVGLLIYATGAPSFIKWPLILAAVGAGAMVAFVPFEERPLDHWVITFFRVLYRPTQFFWKRESKIPTVFTFEANEAVVPRLVEEIDLTPARRERVKEYLLSLQTPQLDEWDQYQEAYTQRIAGMFSQGDELVVPNGHTNTAPPFSAPAPIITFGSPLPAQHNVLPRAQTLDELQAAAGAVSIQSASQQQDGGVPAYVSSDGADASVQLNHAPSVAETRQPVSVPELQSVRVDTQSVGADTTTTTDAQSQEGVFSDVQYQPTVLDAQQQLYAATFNPDLPFANLSAQPNSLAGMVFDAQGKPIPHVVVEILTPDGMPARAVKTNLLGQFVVATPLSPNTYTVRSEKDGFHFPLYQLTTNNTVLPPIEIRSLS